MLNFLQKLTLHDTSGRITFTEQGTRAITDIDYLWLERFQMRQALGRGAILPTLGAFR